jgi:hypothetical protein
MKVYLDDERTTPEGWHRVYWPDKAIALLKTGDVTQISLDHDLGDDDRELRPSVSRDVGRRFAEFVTPLTLQVSFAQRPVRRVGDRCVNKSARQCNRLLA